MWVGGEGQGEEAGMGSGFLRMVYGTRGSGGAGTRTEDGEMEWAADSAEGGGPPSSLPCPTLLLMMASPGTGQVRESS